MTDRPTFAVTDSAGVRIVVNHEPQWRSDEGWTISAVPAVAIGDVQGDPNVLFDRILGVTRLSDGRIVVLDGGSSELRFFDELGEYLMAVGGPGDGPGEINRPVGLLRTSGDTLAIGAVANWEVHWFTANGEFIRRDRLDAGRHSAAVGTIAGCPPRPPALMPDASYLACVGVGVERNQLAGVQRSSHLLVRSPHDVSWVDTLGTMHGFSSNLNYSAAATQITAGGTPLRIFVGDPAFFEIDVIEDRSGRTMSIRYPGGLAPVQSSDVARYEEYLVEWRASVPPGVYVPPTEDNQYAPHKPGFSELHHDAAGFVWALEYAPPWERARSAFVFSEEGVLLGKIATPPDLKIMEIGQDYVIGVWRNPLDVEFVHLYTIDRSGT